MINFLDVLDEVVVEVPAVHEQTALIHMARAARHFCRGTKVWQKHFQFNTTAGEDIYTITPSDNGVVLGIVWVAREGVHLQGRWSTSMARNEATAVPSGPPTLYHYLEGTGVQVSPVPDKTYAMEGMQYLAPSRLAAGLPEWLMETWGDAIIALTCANLLSMPEKDWTNAPAGELHMARYMVYENEARIHARGEDQRTPPEPRRRPE